MTRINLVPPQELMDQHLFAEFREIKMVPKALARSIKARGIAGVLSQIPNKFTLNTGHVTFFYNKGQYLHTRYEQLRTELSLRGVNFNREAALDPDNVMGVDTRLMQDYNPTPEALSVVRSRIAEKIAMKPSWYKKTDVKGENNV